MTALRRHAADVTAIIGAAAFVFGLAQLSSPLAWTVGGAGVFALAVLWARRERP